MSFKNYIYIWSVMEIFNKIAEYYKAFRSRLTLKDNRQINGLFEGIGCDPFARVIFRNIVELLTDITNDVTLINKNGKKAVLFAEFKAFFDTWGKVVLNRLYISGYVVIGHKLGRGFFIMHENSDYYTVSDVNKSIVRPIDESVSVYVMRSNLYIEEGISDKTLLIPFLDFLDNVLNASATISKRLGTLVVASPKNLTSAATEVILDKEEKEELERNIASEYGTLSRQKQILMLPREMSFTTINLSGLDQKTTEKARLAILAIADRVKVPANQIAIIDANSSKSLSNGSEYKEGDYNKYQSYERLLNQTFITMANHIGLKVDYTIYNKPLRATI